MKLRRWWFSAKAWLIYKLDHFVTWSPLIQIPVMVLLTAILVFVWAGLVRTSGNYAHGGATWWALTRFMDGGTMAGDSGRTMRLLAVGVSASGILLLSLVTGAFASKLSERLEDLRAGKSPVVERDHVLILGFDAKVPLVAGELARAKRRRTLVTLALEDKMRQDALLRAARQVPGSRLRTLARYGDPRIELALLRVAADRAGCIVLIPPHDLDDDSAARWTLSTLLALRRITAPSFAGKIIAEVRRSEDCFELRLAAEAGLAGSQALDLELIASDDVIARVLAQSVRHGAVYLALREVLSFGGSEIYLEPLPKALIGRPFEAAHERVIDGIVVGIQRAGQRHQTVPRNGEEQRPLGEGDQLLVLEVDEGSFKLGGSLPPGTRSTYVPEEPFSPRSVTVLGGNRTLPRLVSELDRTMVEGSVVKLRCPHLEGREQESLDTAQRGCKRVMVERYPGHAPEIGRADDPAIAKSDGVIILGCEDHRDPDGDASAISLLLQIRQRRRAGQMQNLKRSITEVRDPSTAQQIAATLDDLLVSTDVVAMMLAHVAFDPRLTPVYRELLESSGVELEVRSRRGYLPDGPGTFAEVMANARVRGEVAIGFYPDLRPRVEECARTRVELGQIEVDARSVVWLNPPREAEVPEAEGAGIIVLAHP